MSTEFVQYCGRSVPKASFRAFIYGRDEQEKLVNSWAEYEREISSGLWFPQKSDVPVKIKKKKGHYE